MMARGKKGRLLLLVAGVVCLIASGVMWWALARDGITIDGAVRPAAFTLMGLFWVLYSQKSKSAE